MCNNRGSTVFYSNIITKNVKNNIVITPDMIIKKVQTGVKKNGDIVYKEEFNKEFWQEQVERWKDKNVNISVVLDEAHEIFNARRAMSKTNRILGTFVALIRRVVTTSTGTGKLIMLTQLERRIDVIAKEMCSRVRFVLCHYQKTCKKCGFTWQENNEVSEIQYACPQCGNHKLAKYGHTIECWLFKTMENFVLWKYFGGKKTYFRHYYINDIENYFGNYSTLQWDNLILDV